MKSTLIGIAAGLFAFAIFFSCTTPHPTTTNLPTVEEPEGTPASHTLPPVSETQTFITQAPSPQTAPTCPPPLGTNYLKSLGMYVGVAVDPNVDPVIISQQMYNNAATLSGGYTVGSIFLSTAFGNVNNAMYPWPRIGTTNKFNLNVINQQWSAHLLAIFKAFSCYHIRPHICFVDQFHKVEDNPGPDPFRQMWGQDWSPEPEYSSYVAVGQGTQYDGKQTWLKWDEVKPGQYSNYQLVGVNGKANGMFIDEVIKNYKVVKLQDPSFTLEWKWSNEDMAYIDNSGPNPRAVNAKSRGDRDEVISYVKKKFVDAGFIPNKDTYCFFDYSALVNGRKQFLYDPKTHKQIGGPSYPILANAFSQGIRKKHNARLELHGILTVDDIKKYIAGAGLNEQFVDWSTDGDIRMQAQYVLLGKSSYKEIDLKLDAKPGQTWDTQHYMVNFYKYFPPYRDYPRKQQ